MSPLDDAFLVEEILKGEVDLYASVVERYDRRIRSLIRASVSDTQACEDIVQQVFYIAFRSLSHLRAGGRLAPWLNTIARRCVADHIRKRIPESSLEFPASLPAPESRALGWVWDEVRLLQPSFSEVLTLRYIHRLSYEEIGRTLKLPISTVRGRIYEARRALRTRMERGGLS